MVSTVLHSNCSRTLTQRRLNTNKIVFQTIAITCLGFLFLLTYLINSPAFTKGKNKLIFNHTLLTVSKKKVEKPLNQTLENKYILTWTSSKTSPFLYLESQNSVFIKNQCTWTNCFVTSNRNLLGDVSEFEAILFHGPELHLVLGNKDFPKVRSSKQKYVYASIESAALYPVCNDVWNNFFNWTWTYKLDSDAIWGYFSVWDMNETVIGPKKDMQWINLYNMEPVDSTLKTKLRSKKKAAAWFVSNCNTLSLREEFVQELQHYLSRYGLTVDVYGVCGIYHCPRTMMSGCLEKLSEDYFFYLAFENSISEDYVTEKVVYALNSNTVPIVFGGANYSRFLPRGSYLDARLLKPKALAEKIYTVIQNPAMYQQFFKWKRYYAYHYRYEYEETNDYCNFCAMLNAEHAESMYEDFVTWWNGNRCGDGSDNTWNFLTE